MANIIVRSAGVISAFLLTAFLARFLEIEQFGQYSFLMALVAVAAIPAQAGLPELVLRETARAHHDKNWMLMKGVWLWSSKMVTLSSIIIIIFCLLLYSYFLTEKLSDFSVMAIVVSLFFIPVSAFGALRGAMLRGLGHVVPGLLPEYVIRPFASLVAVVMYVLLIKDLSAEVAIYVHVMTGAFAFVVGAILLKKLAPLNVVSAPSMKGGGRQWRMSAMILALMAGLTILLQQMDLLMLGAFSQGEQVALYRVASQCSLLVSFGMTATLSALAPHIIKAHKESNEKKMRMLVINSSRITAFISLVPVLFYTLFGDMFISKFFGEDYISSFTPLIILSISQAVVAVVGPVSVLMVMTGHESVSACVMVATILINGVANLLLIPTYGALGAAVGTGAAIVIQHILLSIAVKSRLGFIAAAFGRVR